MMVSQAEGSLKACRQRPEVDCQSYHETPVEGEQKRVSGSVQDTLSHFVSDHSRLKWGVSEEQ